MRTAVEYISSVKGTRTSSSLPPRALLIGRWLNEMKTDGEIIDRGHGEESRTNGAFLL